MKNKKKITTLFIFMLLFGSITVTSQALYLDDLEDVTILNVQDNQHLIYDIASKNWTNEAFTCSIPSWLYSYHPHNQDLNTTSSPTFASLNTGQGAYELYQMNQHVTTTSSVLFNTIKLGGSDGIRVLNVYESGDHTYMEIKADSTKQTGILLKEGSSNKWQIARIGTDDKFGIYNYGTSSYEFVIDDSDGDIYIGQTTGTAGYELDVNGDIDCTSLHESSDIRMKDIKFNLEDIPDNIIIRLITNMNFYIFEYKDPQLQNLTFKTEGYGCSVIAQELFWELKNFTNNQQLNDKLAHGLVTVGNDTQLWSISKTNFLMIYAYGVKLLMEEVFK